MLQILRSVCIGFESFELLLKCQVFFVIQFAELQIGEVMEVVEKDRVGADIKKSGVRVVERSTAVRTALCNSC